MKALSTIFCGTSEFGIPALRALCQSSPPLLVISQPDRPKGRKLQLSPTPISQTAIQLGLPLLRPENPNAPEVLEQISRLNPDVIVTASYGAMLGRSLRRIPPLGAINLHPSLLPLLRGASPIQSALLSGMNTTGMSIFRLSARMDAGDMLMQQQVEITPEDDYGSLHGRLADIAAQMLLEYLQHPSNYPPIAQDDALATYCGKLHKEDQQIHWNSPAEDIRRRVRAFSPEPGAYCAFRSAQLKILAAEPLPDYPPGVPGTVHQIIKNTGFSVHCADHPILIKHLQPSGKSAMSSWAFQLGARLTEGQMLGS